MLLFYLDYSPDRMECIDTYQSVLKVIFKRFAFTLHRHKYSKLLACSTAVRRFYNNSYCAAWWIEKVKSSTFWKLISKKNFHPLSFVSTFPINTFKRENFIQVKVIRNYFTQVKVVRNYFIQFKVIRNYLWACIKII